jgi:hypothetical protein
MNPKCAVTRQNLSPSATMDIRSGQWTRGLDSVTTLSTATRSCSARLWRRCQLMTGGTPLVVRVRNTAVPGTRGTPRAVRSARNFGTVIGVCSMLWATATEPRCQISISP